MKIIYAASNRKGAHFQLNRFLRAAKDKHQIKAAAHERQNYEYDIDWILDALYSIFSTVPNYDGVAMDIYYEQIKQFAPDLVISDCEPITTKFANDLNIPVWQVSPLLLYSQFPGQISLRTKYPSLFNKYSEQMKELEKSERFFIYSHLCEQNLSIKYEWIRPYAKIGSLSPLYEHNIVAASIANNKPLLHKLKQEDALFFSEYQYEKYPIPLYNINQIEYPHSLKNAKNVIVYGCEDLLADAFYNNKFAHMIPDFYDQEVMMSSLFNEYIALGKITYDMNINEMPDIDIQYNKNVKHLHEELV